MFEALGLSAGEESLYTVLIHSPRSTVAELAAYGAVSSQQATRDLHRLVRFGLANRLPGRQARYIAVAPDIAIEPLLAKQENELRQARIASATLSKAFHEASRQEHPAELVEIITGEANIRSRSDQLPAAAQYEIRGFDRPPYVDSAFGENTQEVNRMREGITYRVVYSAQAVTLPGRLEGDIRGLIAAGEQARVRPELPTKLWIVDDKMALIPIKTRQQGIDASFIVRPCDLLDSLMALFEAEWERAIPLRTFLGEDATGAGADEPDETRMAVLSCLAAGLTDEGIARSLGCSLRTAQRHIRRLMQDLNVTSRFQAGMEARQRGWA
ncbi:MAG TPA: LuxR C-terminal-related transcriptional regulator [Streptosporangiaceae bacterium]|jgi:DNA-binding CsgD family transcriptional regulator/DNA-binding MarR family transcriptional regulator